jgi:hypothetical protein
LIKPIIFSKEVVTCNNILKWCKIGGNNCLHSDKTTLLKNVWGPISYWNCTSMIGNEWLGFLLVCLFVLLYGCKSTFIKRDSLWANGLLCSCGIAHCLSTLLLVLQGSLWCFFQIGSLDLVMARRCGCKVHKLEARIQKRHQGKQEKYISLMGNCWSLDVVFGCLLVFTHSREECFWCRLGFFKFMLHWKTRSRYVLNYWWKLCKTKGNS